MKWQMVKAGGCEEEGNVEGSEAAKGEVAPLL